MKKGIKIITILTLLTVGLTSCNGVDSTKETLKEVEGNTYEKHEESIVTGRVDYKEYDAKENVFKIYIQDRWGEEVTPYKVPEYVYKEIKKEEVLTLDTTSAEVINKTEGMVEPGKEAKIEYRIPIITNEDVKNNKFIQTIKIADNAELEKINETTITSQGKKIDNAKITVDEKNNLMEISIPDLKKLENMYEIEVSTTIKAKGYLDTTQTFAKERYANKTINDVLKTDMTK